MSTAERIGIWVLTNLGQPDEPGPAKADQIIDALANSSVPEALGSIAHQLEEN